jgi:chromosomal replication initiation ATPase DnaA
MTKQLVLELPFIQGMGVEDFHLSLFNQAAFRTVSDWPNWPDPVAIMYGPEGCGKSHLAAIWVQAATATILSPSQLVADHIMSLTASGAFLIEDMDRLKQKEGSLIDEKALFHLLNLIREAGGHLMITARKPPDQWGIITPDLLSRLRLAPLVEITAPDDALFRVLLAKLLHDRQLQVEPNVIEYLMVRIERSFASARDVVAALDTYSLAKGRKITRAIAADVLNDLEKEML